MKRKDIYNKLKKNWKEGSPREFNLMLKEAKKELPKREYYLLLIDVSRFMFGRKVISKEFIKERI